MSYRTLYHRTGAALLTLACSATTVSAQDVFIIGDGSTFTLAPPATGSARRFDSPASLASLPPSQLAAFLEALNDGPIDEPGAAQGRGTMSAGVQTPLVRDVVNHYDRGDSPDVTAPLKDADDVASEIATGMATPPPGLSDEQEALRERRLMEARRRQQAAYQAREQEKEKAQAQAVRDNILQRMEEQKQQQQEVAERRKSDAQEKVGNLLDQMKKEDLERARDERLAAIQDAEVPELPQGFGRPNAITSDEDQQSLIDDATEVAQDHIDEQQSPPPGDNDGEDDPGTETPDNGEPEPPENPDEQTPDEDADAGDPDEDTGTPGEGDGDGEDIGEGIGEPDPWADFQYFARDEHRNNYFDLQMLGPTATYAGPLEGMAGDGSPLTGTVSMTFNAETWEVGGAMAFDAGENLSFIGEFFLGEGFAGNIEGGQTFFGGSVTPETSSVEGHFYGPNAEEMGADWSFEVIGGDMPGIASGIFAGSR